ncbi:MAG: 5'-methylthioadenosine/S-adenosylhomocysteine nucleosidase [Bacteroidetes bacterium]|nr:5'-methylthioadenosine/S-adenosylhomocysteine nucleosidase [Bacteroidota bacterium]
MRIKILILCPLPLEFDAVVQHLRAEKETTYRENKAYLISSYNGKHDQFEVICVETGMRNAEMALATEQAIREFNPQLAILFGICGGIKDVGIGDLLIANKIYAYDVGKEDPGGFKTRPVALSLSGELLARAQTLSRSTQWHQRCKLPVQEDARVFIGAIAAGDKVVADVDNETFNRIRTHYNDALGLEMEAYGFGTAIQAHRLVYGMVLRGVSDMCAGKHSSDQENWQPIAADRAAAFLFEFLHQLDGQNFIIELMDTRALSKAIYEMVLPFEESIREIKHDFSDTANAPVKALWAVVKPLLKSEIDTLMLEPNDPDAQADVRNQLKKLMDSDAALKAQLEQLLKSAKDSGANAAVNIINSKNVVNSSNITVGGDFRLGDN